MDDGTPREPVSAAAKKKRPWFQFHLSTAIVLMFVAAILLWANLRPTIRSIAIVSGLPNVEEHSRGWPVRFWTTVLVFSGTHRVSFEPEPYTDYADDMPMPRFWTGMLAADGAVAVVTLLATGVLLEWRIRRKERHQ
jgi:hypothetical protein